MSDKYKKSYKPFSGFRSKFDFRVQPYGKFALVPGTLGHRNTGTSDHQYNVTLGHQDIGTMGGVRVPTYCNSVVNFKLHLYKVTMLYGCHSGTNFWIISISLTSSSLILLAPHKSNITHLHQSELNCNNN